MGKKAQLRRQKKETRLEVRAEQAVIVPLWWIRARGMIPILGIVIALSLGVTLRLSNISLERRSPDEKVYTMQASAIAREGLEGMRKVIKEYNDDRLAWNYPPPTRIGYTFLVAAVMKATHLMDERAGIYTSVLFSILSLFAVLIICLRFFNRWIAVIALSFMAVSPMELAIAGRCWQDGVFAFFGLLLIYLSCELSEHPNRRFLYIPFALLGSYSLLIKESGILLFGLCVIWVLWVITRQERPISGAFMLLISVLVGLCAVGLVLISVIGSPGMILRILRHAHESMPGNAYATEFQAGPWYRILEGLWILTPMCLLLSIVGFCYSLNFLHGCTEIKTSVISRSIFGIEFFMIAFIAVTMSMPYFKNLRFISVVFGPFYIISAIGVWGAVEFIRSKFQGIILHTVIAIAALAVFIGMINAYIMFDTIFSQHGIKDLAAGLLRQYENIYDREK